MLLIRGVESVESSSSTKATKNSIDKGVAGRNMLAKNNGGYRVGFRLARDRLSQVDGVVLGRAIGRVRDEGEGADGPQSRNSGRSRKRA